MRPGERFVELLAVPSVPRAQQMRVIGELLVARPGSMRLHGSTLQEASRSMRSAPLLHAHDLFCGQTERALQETTATPVVGSALCLCRGVRETSSTPTAR